MGQGWGEVGRHLPSLYHMDYQLTQIKLCHSGITRCICFTSSGFDLHSLSADFLTASTRSGLRDDSALFNAVVMVGSIQGRMEYDKYRFSYGNVLEFLVLCWSGYSMLWSVALWIWFCLGNPGKLPSSLPRCLLEASCPRLNALLISLSSVAVGERSCFNSVATAFVMPRPRHRMRSRS